MTKTVNTTSYPDTVSTNNSYPDTVSTTTSYPDWSFTKTRSFYPDWSFTQTRSFTRTLTVPDHSFYPKPYCTGPLLLPELEVLFPEITFFTRVGGFIPGNNLFYPETTVPDHSFYPDTLTVPSSMYRCADCTPTPVFSSTPLAPFSRILTF